MKAVWNLRHDLARPIDLPRERMQRGGRALPGCFALLAGRRYVGE
jgi:hypothetical protein